MMNHQPRPGLHVQLQNARRRAGLTQEQLAGLSTVSVRAIRDLEQGRVQHPRRETLRLLADAMRLSGGRRIELELAVDSASAGRVFQDEFGPELAAPPAALRPLIGRAAEVEALTGLLGASHARQLTLVGLPGVGKTRLAQEVALHLHSRDRLPVLWVPMDRDAERTGGSGSADAASTMTGWVRELVRGGDTHDELADVIGGRPALVVLDGLEGAPSALRPVTELLQSCSRLTVLATTCRPVPTPTSRLLTVAPLPVPGADRTGGAELRPTEHPAVELMLSHAAHIRPDLLPTESVISVLAQICRHLDGIPGWLETAASWLLLHSPEQVLDLARTSPLLLADPLTEAVPATAEACYGERVRHALAELSPRAEALLDALAALPEPWTVEAAARAAGLPFAEVARDVHALLVRGLVRQVPAAGSGTSVGFALLNLVRSVTAERREALTPTH
jgi:transcriptional regulator with XRE-family HTH domain